MTAQATEPILLSDTPATLPHPNPKVGGTLTLKMVAARTYSNGTVIFACLHDGCPYTADTAHKVFGHLAKHTPGRGANISKALQAKKNQPQRVSRDDIHAMLDAALDAAEAATDVVAITERMEAWKERAIAAEKKLREVEKAQRTLAIMFGNP